MEQQRPLMVGMLNLSSLNPTLAHASAHESYGQHELRITGALQKQSITHPSRRGGVVDIGNYFDFTGSKSRDK